MSEIRELSVRDLETECVELLPGREALGTWKMPSFNSASIVASNSALALNIGTVDSFAQSSVQQGFTFHQG